MLTLDEAIKHCEEKTKELREQPFKEKMDIEDVAACEECAEEHEQLAEWLKELKELKENKGEWSDLSTDGRHIGWIACSVCGQEPPSESNLRTNFCPNCGADMRGDKE